ncbi:MAG: porin [Wolbachia endosymbiont of Menacanthus eurysternus]|nr:MAG: porin [Wolbachia endosymbiont of Menacanthus eurysternus]
MKQSTYTKTALASLLALCSFSGFTADFYEKQDNAAISKRIEVLKTQNRKLKDKIKRVCNTNLKLDPVMEQLDKKKETIKLIKKAKVLKNKNSNVETLKTENYKIKKSGIKTKIINNRINEKNKTNPIVPITNSVNIAGINQKTSDLKITFSGVIDTQSYNKLKLSNKNHKSHDVKLNNDNTSVKISPLSFLEKVRSVDDYKNMGMITDTVLHLRAENKNESIGILYGADIQFHVPVTENMGTLQDINAGKSKNAHIFLDSKYGSLRFGYQFGPEALMRLDATKIATIDGAADSNWFRKANLKEKALTFPFYVTPRLYTESFSNGGKKLSFSIAEKYNKSTITTLPFRIAYYSPNYMGAKFGISYSPRYENSLSYINNTNVNNGIINTNPSEEEIDIITTKLINASKFRFNNKVEIDGKKYKSADEAIDDLVKNVKFTGNSATQTEKNEALVGIIDKILPAIDVTTVILPTKYNETHKTNTVPAVDVTDITVLESKNTMKDELINKIPSLNETGGSKDKFVKDLKEAVSKLLNTRLSAVDIKSKIKEIFLEKAINTMIYEKSITDLARHIGPDYEHIISAGASYEYDFNQNNIKIKTSIVGEYGKAKTLDTEHSYKEFEHNDLIGTNLGVSADYMINKDHNIRFAASFAYLGKSGQSKIAEEHLREADHDNFHKPDKKTNILDQLVINSENITYWTAGAGYQYENFYTSLTYFSSKMNDGDKLHDIALGIQYDLSPAYSKSKFIPYAVFHYFTSKEKRDNNHVEKYNQEVNLSSNKEEGGLFLTGVKFSF